MRAGASLSVYRTEAPEKPHQCFCRLLYSGLRISPKPTSDNLNPQETTKQDALEMALDGAELSCPGSSVVADEDV